VSPLTVLAIYALVWWCVFFAVLPLGVPDRYDGRELTLGADRGAPDAPRLGWKVFLTSAISAAVVAVIFAVFAVFDLRFEDLVA
jgi:predicted secreted protein